MIFGNIWRKIYNYDMILMLFMML